MTDITKISTEDLTQFSYKDLLAHQAKVNKALELRHASEKDEVYKSLLALAAEKGFAFSEFTDHKPAKAKKAPSKIKYINPNDKEQVWTGQGRKPKWLVKLIDGGAKLEDFEVK